MQEINEMLMAEHSSTCPLRESCPELVPPTERSTGSSRWIQPLSTVKHPCCFQQVFYAHMFLRSIHPFSIKRVSCSIQALRLHAVHFPSCTVLFSNFSPGWRVTFSFYALMIFYRLSGTSMKKIQLLHLFQSNPFLSVGVEVAASSHCCLPVGRRRQHRHLCLQVDKETRCFVCGRCCNTISGLFTLEATR